MLKTPEKNTVDHQIKVLQEWLFLIKELDFLTDKVLQNVFETFKRATAEKVLQTINMDHRLTKYDENIYTYYSHLMNCYKRTVDMYHESKESIRNPKVCNIVEGIYSVIISRLKVFEERYGIEDDQTDANPVFLEKKRIIHDNLKLYSRNFQALKERFTAKYGGECMILSRQNLYENMEYKVCLHVAEQIIKIVEDCMGDGFFHIYGVAVKSSLNNLNDMQVRKAAAYYYKLLEQEKEILGSLIIIQIQALEMEIEKGDSSLEEKTVIFNLLANLREGYQYLGKEINEIMECFKEAEGRRAEDVTEIKEDFLEDLTISAEQVLSATQFDELRETYVAKLKQFNETFILMVTDFLEKELSTINVNRSIYETKRNLSNNALMSDEMTAVFRRIVLDFEEKESQYKECNFYDIIKGIYETIDIKISSLKEMKDTFLIETDDILKSFDKSKMVFSEDDRDEVVQNAFEMWNEEMVNCPPQDDHAMEIVEKVLRDILKCETVHAFRELINKKHTAAMDSVKKKILNFKKDSLLFEVSTFEEIMTYSVSRLYDSEEPLICQYVEAINEFSKMLESILKKNNIEIIKPQPRELFNGKEHEVLLAEKNPDFNKGEVIKVMNCGYKQDGQVILRANVIAAK